MQQVTELKDLGDTIMYFYGANVGACLTSAQSFAAERQASVHHYFIQPPFGRSKTITILADYS